MNNTAFAPAGVFSGVGRARRPTVAEDETFETIEARRKARRLLGFTEKPEWAIFATRSRLSVNPQVFLSGAKAWKYRAKLQWRKMKISAKEASSYLELWGSSFKKIEGTFGSGVSSYFRFLKWLFLLNVGIFLLLFCFIVMPHIVFVKDSMPAAIAGALENITTMTTMMTTTSENKLSIDLVQTCSEKYVVNDEETVIQLILDFIQGTGWMEKTLLFYGVYIQNIVSMGTWQTAVYSYNMPLAYLLVTFAYLFLSLYLMINHTNQTLMEQLQGTPVKDRPAHRGYSNIVFASWDFSLDDATSAEMRQATIFNEIRSNLEEKRLLSKKLGRTPSERWCLYLLRLLINVFAFGALGVAAYIISFATEWSTDLKNEPDYERQHKLVQLLVEFLPSIVITALNIFIPMVFTQIVKAEDYHPDFEIRITLGRTVFLRLASIAVLLFTLYYQIRCDPKDQCGVGMPPDCPQLRCWETYMGQNIYKLIVMNFVVNFAVVAFVETPIRIIGRKCTHRLITRALSKREFDIPKNVLDLVYIQTLCWLGTFFAPLLPVTIVITYFFLFYLKKVTVLYNYQPAATPYRSSRSQVFFMLILMIAFFLCCVPIIYCVWKIPPSHGCGPFRDLGHMYDILVKAIGEFPQPLGKILKFVTSPAFIVGSNVTIGLVVYYYRTESKVNKGMVVVLKEQVKHEYRDKQFLLRRLNEVTNAQNGKPEVNRGSRPVDQSAVSDRIEGESSKDLVPSQSSPRNYNTFGSGAAPLATPDSDIP